MTRQRWAFELVSLLVSAVASLEGCSVDANVLSGVDGGNPGTGDSDANPPAPQDAALASESSESGSSESGSGESGSSEAGAVGTTGSEGGATADGGSEVGWDGGYPTLCPNFQSLPTCQAAPGAMYCTNVALGCGLDAVPSGLQCTGPSQCAMTVYPCPGWQTDPAGGGGITDGYICSCVAGHWACEDCSEGAGTCSEAGAPGH
jgi:hypothetical protein